MLAHRSILVLVALVLIAGASILYFVTDSAPPELETATAAPVSIEDSAPGAPPDLEPVSKQDLSPERHEELPSNDIDPPAEVGQQTAADPEPTEPEPPAGASIHGVVVATDTGLPVPDAVVTARQTGPGSTLADGYQRATSDRRGLFLLPGPFVNGEVQLSAVAEQYRSPTLHESVFIEDRDLFQHVVRVSRTLALNGRVYGEDRLGLRAVMEVRAEDHRYCCFESRDDGTFSLDDVLGQLGLWSASPDTPIHVWAIHPLHLTGFAAISLAEVGEEHLLEIELTRGAVIAGRVVDMTGSPFAGVRLSCYPLNDDRHSRLRETESDTDGSFSLGGLHPGPNRLEPEVRRGALVPTERVVDFDLLARQEILGVTIVYGPGYSIGGQALKQLEREPLADRIVTLHHHDWLEPIQALTNNDGNFLFPSVAEGKYSVVLRGRSMDDPFPPVQLSDVRAGTTDLLFLAEVEPTDGLILLTVREALTGKPISGDVRIGLDWTAYGQPQRDQLLVTADSAGRVELQRLDHSSYRMEVAAPGFASSRVELALTEIELEVRAEILLRRPIQLRGRVTDDTGRAIPTARVKAFAVLEPGGLLPDVGSATDPSGYFTLLQAPPDTTVVTASAPGFAPASVPFGETSQLSGYIDITLIPGARVEGYLERPDGTAAQALTLVLRGVVATHHATTDHEGYFIFENVESGEIQLGLPQGQLLGTGQISGTEPLQLELTLD